MPEKDQIDITTYDHYGHNVSVRQDLKDKHRDYCLCYICGRFYPDNRDKNCEIANNLYYYACSTGIIVPVWACPQFCKQKPDIEDIEEEK